MQVKDANRHRRTTALFALACFVLQVGVMSNLNGGMGMANLSLVFAGVYALAVGGRSSVVAGFFSGLLFDLLTTGPIGLSAALLTVFSYALGSEARNRFADGYVTVCTSFGTGTLAVLLAYHLTMLLVGVGANVVDLVFLRTLPSFAMTFLCFLPVAHYLVRASANGRVLGRASRASSRLGTHYDMRDV